jgi:hypothetical protein
MVTSVSFSPAGPAGIAVAGGITACNGDRDTAALIGAIRSSETINCNEYPRQLLELRIEWLLIKSSLKRAQVKFSPFNSDVDGAMSHLFLEYLRPSCTGWNRQEVDKLDDTVPTAAKKTG